MPLEEKEKYLIEIIKRLHKDLIESHKRIHDLEQEMMKTKKQLEEIRKII